MEVHLAALSFRNETFTTCATFYAESNQELRFCGIQRVGEIYFHELCAILLMEMHSIGQRGAGKAKG